MQGRAQHEPADNVSTGQNEVEGRVLWVCLDRLFGVAAFIDSETPVGGIDVIRSKYGSHAGQPQPTGLLITFTANQKINKNDTDLD